MDDRPKHKRSHDHLARMRAAVARMDAAEASMGTALRDCPSPSAPAPRPVVDAPQGGNVVPFTVVRDRILVAALEAEVDALEDVVRANVGRAQASERSLAIVEANVARAICLLRMVEGVALVDRAVEVLLGLAPIRGDAS